MTKEEGIQVTSSRCHLTTPIQLGFCEPIHDLSLVAHRSAHWIHWDGGQVGGRPSWLHPKELPLKPLTCRSCTTPLVFICQLYAPDDDIQEAFHRSLYVFACPQPSCVPETDTSIRVLRVQLPQVNPFYPPTNNEEEDNNNNNNNNNNTNDDDEEWKQHLPEFHGVHPCAVCGQRGKGKCPKQGLYFCGRAHQIEYKKYPTTALPSCYQCHELVVDEEPSLEESTELRETLFATNNNDDGNDSDEDLEQDDLNAMTGARRNNTPDDGTTFDFYSRISRAKQQCVRYSKWQQNQEVWIRSDHQPTTIPQCPTCGAPRKFECQIMPQLLQYLFHPTKTTTEKPSQVHQQAFLAATNIVNEASPDQVPPMLKEIQEEQLAIIQQSLLKSELDWGTICIYTCTKSCDRPVGMNNELGAYHEEYAWKQPPLD